MEDRLEEQTEALLCFHSGAAARTRRIAARGDS